MLVLRDNSYMSSRGGSRLVRETLGQQIAAAVRHDLMSGLITHDDLQQEALCRRFGTSRVPVRDALRELVHEGFLEWMPNKQVRIVTFDAVDVRDMFDIEIELSGRLVRRAAERAAEADLQKLVKLHDVMVENTEAGRLGDLLDDNRYFHRTIDDLARSPKLTAALRSVTVDVHLEYLYRDLPDAERANVDHARLLDAIRLHDPNLAESVMRDHVGIVRQRVITDLVNEQPKMLERPANTPGRGQE